MNTAACWFRPRLDDPGAWPPWTLEPDEEREVRVALHDGATAARRRLQAEFGAVRDAFGAAEFATAVAIYRPGTELALARAVAAMEFYAARASARLARKPMHWQRLRRHVAGRLTVTLAANAAESILCRAILARVPDCWVPVAFVERAVEQAAGRNAAVAAVSTALDLRLPVEGGRPWILAKTREALEALQANLAQRRPSLVELIREPAHPLGGNQLAVVYRIATLAPDLHRLWYYAPGEGPQQRFLQLRLADCEVRSEKERPQPELPRVRALRCWRFDTSEPPLYGLRASGAGRRLGPALWTLQRAVSILLHG